MNFSQVKPENFLLLSTKSKILVRNTNKKVSKIVLNSFEIQSQK